MIDKKGHSWNFEVKYMKPHKPIFASKYELILIFI
jgi:hypothetical protein